MNSLAHRTPASSSTDAHAFTARFGKPVPAALRAASAGMSWTEFERAYTESATIRLGGWRIADRADDQVELTATIATGDRITPMSITATGPLAALTGMLYEIGAPVEIVALHQQSTSDGYFTFIHADRDDRRTWAMGRGDDATESAMQALIAAANMLG
ncbi:hypothetical protein [Jongsikchunia kroppenstedtii]|uniref:hypothetical protein n=1 Tax=Jongsikchunia kroppenstedtii TaxID=1121721 RepID=UPI000363F3BA|nr:hypothetical protein [Jongsikchunia kroppenstedtii]